MPVASMKGRSRRIRLSPNEEARLLREEREKRRKIRLQQVRDQAKVNATKIREAVKEEKAFQVSLLAAELKNEWELEKTEKLRKLNEHHLKSLQHVGEAHVNATEQVPREVEDAIIAQQNLQKASKRHLEAIQRMREKREEEEAAAKWHIMTRKVAVNQEKERAAVVAAMPRPAKDPIGDIDIPKVRPIKVTDVNAFSLTHYHLPSEEYAVERAQTPEQTDAKAAAQLEQERIEQLEEDERVAAHGRFEKAQLRHKYARRKELLKQDYNEMLLDLSDLRRTDIARRQQVVAKIPRSVYQAPQRRQEEKEDDQRKMEAVFEDMYMAATDQQGDLTLALDHRPPVSGVASTLDHSVQSSTVPANKGPAQFIPLKDLTNITAQSLQALSKSNDSGLSRLMQRIQRQRDTWVDRSAEVDAVVAEGRPEPANLQPRPANLQPKPANLQPKPANLQPKHPLQSDTDSTITTAPTMTQYTLTSDDVTKASSSNVSSTIDISSLSSTTMSKVSSVRSSLPSTLGTNTTVTSSDITVTSMGTIEEGTVTSTTVSQDLSRRDTTDTLLHPMEIAAKVRQRPQVQKAPSPYVEHLYPADFSKAADRSQKKQAVEDFRLEQQRLEMERQEIERKIMELKRQAMTQPVINLEGSQRSDNIPYSIDRPQPAPTQSYQIPDKVYSQVLTDYLHRPEKESDSEPEYKITTIAQDLKELADSHKLTVPEPADKLQQYKQRALDRYREKQRQNKSTDTQTSEKPQPTVDSARSAIPDPYSRTHAGIGHFEDVSGLTKNASMSYSQGLSPDFTISTISPKSKTSPPSPTRDLKEKEIQDKVGDSPLSEYDIKGKMFDSRQAQLKAQLAEIQQQKNEIHERQKKHHDEMVELKNRWQQEIQQQYSPTRSLISESLRLSMARSKAEIEVEHSRSNYSSDRSNGGMEEVIYDNEDDDVFESNSAGQRFNMDKKTKGSKVISLPNKSPHVVHDLSTIQELETPVTDQKAPGFISRPLNSTELSQEPDKLPEKPAVRALFVDMYSNKPAHSPKTPDGVDLGVYPNVPSPGFPAEQHPVNQSWNVPSWMDHPGNKDYTPSVDRVQQIERFPSTTSGEIVLTDVSRDVKDGKQIHMDSMPAVTVTGPEDGRGNKPTEVVDSGYKRSEPEGTLPEQDKPLTYSSYLRGADLDTSPRHKDKSLPTGSYLKDQTAEEPEQGKGPVALGKYVQDLDLTGQLTDLKPTSYPTGSYLREGDVNEESLTQSGPLPTGSYLRSSDLNSENFHHSGPLPTGSYLSSSDLNSEKFQYSGPLPTGSYLRGSDLNEHLQRSGPLPTGSYLRGSDLNEQFQRSGPLPTGSYLREDDSGSDKLKHSGAPSTGSYMTTEDLNEENKSSLPVGSYLRYETTPTKNKESSSLPVGSYLREDDEKSDEKKELGSSISYLTPPTMTPTRSTDKIVRCVTTRAFGCERPIKWRGMKKPEVEEAPLPPPIPVNRVVDETGRVNSPEIVKEPPPPPSMIKQMFEKSSQEPLGIPVETSPIPREKRRSKGFNDQRAMFLSSTPSSAKAVSRLEKSGDGVSPAIPTPEISTGRLSESHISTGKLREYQDSVLSQHPMSQTNGSKFSILEDKSKLSEYTMDSVGRASKSSRNSSVNSSHLEHGRLTLSGVSALTQHTLDDLSPMIASNNQSTSSTPFVMPPRAQVPSRFEVLQMDTSKSSDGSVGLEGSKGPRPTTEGLEAGASRVPNTYAMPSSQPGIRTRGSSFNQALSSHPGSSNKHTGPSAEVVDLASNISERAEAAMYKYDRLMEESRRLREQYEAEERVLLTETGTKKTRPATISHGMASLEADMSSSLEQLAAEETGISDEPNLTLVSYASTPHKSPEQSAKSSESKTLAGSANSNPTDRPGSLISFEQHENSQATLSQVSLFHPGASTISAVPSLPSDPAEVMTASVSTASNASRTSRHLTESGKDSEEPLKKDGMKREGDQKTTDGAGKAASGPSSAQSHLSKTLSSWKKNNALQAQTSADSSSERSSVATVVNTSSDDRKKKEKEMKERTERLYSRLEDVKQHRIDRQRKEEYATNRQRQQEYQKNYQEQLRKRIQAKKS